jgi:Flp pilus assembly protein TadD
MNTISIAKLAASALVLSTTMIGCSMSGTAERPGAVSDGQSAKMAAVAANRATKALAKKQIDRAVALAEAAVEAQPRDAGYRMLLGQVYLAAGRFQSAQQSFTDTLTLDPEREKAALNLALTQIALGKSEAAKSTLSDYRDKLPAADFGLAIALAGDAEEAVRVLEFATRAPDANATTRQNLALAYALAGKWVNARVMAVQDLTAEDADARITQWAQFARPGGAPSQVAALLGTQPNADAGQPTRLALAPMASPVQAAAAEVDIPPVAPAEPESATVAAASAVAYETSVEPAPAAVAPMIRAEPTPAKQAVTRPAAMPVPSFPVASIRPVLDGKFMVQLGAYANAAIAQHAWNRDSRALGLATFEPANAVVRLRKASYVRLSVGGFGTRNDAGQLCLQIKQSGKPCFVRLRQGDAPARWVQRKTGTRLASR